MKKIFAFILAFCLMMTVFCIGAFAAGGEKVDVLTVSGQKKDEKGTLVEIAKYKVFDDGWNAAMELAIDMDYLRTNDYERIVVDLLCDWNATDGEFTDDFLNGKGFNWDAIYFYKNARITLDMNGYTIDRGLTSYQYNGEVMYVETGADVIIENGTIKGGFSCNGAGGIHLNDRANLTLNNVNVTGNVVEDDDGAAIAVYNAATLTMNGGSISENVVLPTISATSYTSNGALYVDDGYAYLNNVKISNNVTKNYSTKGVAVTANNGGYVDLKYCEISGNGYKNEASKYCTALSVIYICSRSEIVITGGKIENNGSDDYDSETRLIDVNNGYLSMYDVKTVTGNKFRYLIAGSPCAVSGILTYALNRVDIEIVNSDFINNEVYGVFTGATTSLGSIYFEKCTFSKNVLPSMNTYTFNFGTNCDISFVDCKYSQVSFNNKNYADIYNGGGFGSGSIVGEGSLAIVISILALVASIVSIGITIFFNKKKKVAVNTIEEDMRSV